MSKPTNRVTFVAYCLRRLGAPVVEINVDDDQLDDRVDDALDFYRDYHYDGSERTYLKHQVTQEDHGRDKCFSYRNWSQHKQHVQHSLPNNIE
jgi:hypothetical protein